MNMKNIFKFLFVTSMVVSTIVLGSCLNDEDKDSYGLSKVTTFPTLSLVDEGAVFYMPLGESYKEPGFSAAVGTEDITASVTVTSVDVSTIGLKTVTYTATNAEGYNISKTRNIYVYNADGVSTTDISGDYTSVITRKVVATGVTANRGPFTLTLTKVCEGHYFCSDLLAGWYWIGGGASYASYHYDGIIRVAANGVVTSDCIGTTPWGGYAYFLSGAAYNFGTGVMTFVSTGDATSGLNAYQWSCTLTKK
ncbi:hypothetical protein FACS1894155_12140 [Bacteroidia bacterium]|nr:hypothetical protein FACS189455_3670 [Bacteroidia bacterium]GHU91983.1 hypothetical protein FACS1894155_12140 [Bacteroidia bacterium]